VVVHEGKRSFGVAAELIARVNEEALMYLETPVRRVGGYDVITPYFGRENAYLPDVAQITRAVESTLKLEEVVHV
jgi:pyruvate dehydrogenase E1 component beta subunit